MATLAEKYRACFGDKPFVRQFVLTLLFLILGMAANTYGIIYATEKASAPVTDIVLSNIPAIDVDGIFFYGPAVLWAIVIALCVVEPKRFLFIFKSVALFLIIRFIFVSLTHIGVFPEQVPITTQNIFSRMSTGGDLFFSGHTGTPFLLALIFWEYRIWRYFFIAASVLFGVIVLLGHFHYSIDVLAAFFITYTINHLAETFFRRDKQIFDSGV